MLYQTFCAFPLVISRIFSTFAVDLKLKLLMNNDQTTTKNYQPTFGRTELAQQYFPYILPCNAWQKLKALMLDDPALAPFATQKRRTFLPSEVNIIYQHLGHP